QTCLLANSDYTTPTSPLPRGEREWHCACHAMIVFTPSPLTGEGWDEGGAGNSVFKRLRFHPHTSEATERVLDQPRVSISQRLSWSRSPGFRMPAACLSLKLLST